MPRASAAFGDVRRLLGRAGLTAREADVYVALLQLRAAPVSAVARTAGLKRVGVYQVLAALERRGLVTHARRGRVVEYHAEPPQALVEFFARQAAAATALRGEAAALRPMLAGLSGGPLRAPRVRVYQGRERMADLYAEIFEHDFRVIYNPSYMYKVFEGTTRAALIGGPVPVKGRELVAAGPGLKQFAQAYPESNIFRFRVLPQSLSFDVTLAAFGDSLTLFCYDDELTVVRLDCKEAAEAFRSVFALLWSFAKPYSQPNRQGNTLRRRRVRRRRTAQPRSSRSRRR